MPPSSASHASKVPLEAGQSKCTIVSNNDDRAVSCVFCKSSELDDINWGRMYGADGIFTHYFCMLFSAALKQNGTDEEGILGFLAEDILKEVKRCQRLKCIFCGELGASIGCCNKRCKTIFHFPCGLENGARNKFHSTFESFCRSHAKHKPVILSGIVDTCPICMSSVESSQRLVKGTCCKASLFHKDCIQKMALSAGYFFKCPTCNKTKQFIHEMRSLGIFVPDQDASWEIDNRFEDLYVRYSHCDAQECSCSRGRDHVDGKGPWSLARCRLCGAAGVHKRCGKLGDATDVGKWACQPCVEVEIKADAKPKSIEIPNNINRPVVKNGKSKQFVSNNVQVVNDKNDDDEHFTLANCYVSSRCFSYFPYTRAHLRRLSTKTLPDWRDMELRVNLVKWIPCQIWNFNGHDQPLPPVPSSSSIVTDTSNQRHSRTAQRQSKENQRRSRSRSIAEMEAEEVMSDLLLKERMSRKNNLPRGGRRKRSLWSAGIADGPKRRKMHKLRVAKSTSDYESSICDGEDLDNGSMSIDHEIEAQEKLEVLGTFANVADPPPPPSFSEIFDLLVESEMEAVRTVGTATVKTNDVADKAIVDPNLTSTVLPLALSSSQPQLEPTPEQMNSFKAIGDRLRTELNQNNNREFELSPPRTKLGYFASTSPETEVNRKQWMTGQAIKDRQVIVGEPEL